MAGLTWRRRKILIIFVALLLPLSVAVYFYRFEMGLSCVPDASRPSSSTAMERSRHSLHPRIQKQFAQLRITTRPVGAMISVDGEDTGRLAPDIVTLDAARSHSIRLGLDGFEPYEIMLELEPNEVRVLEVILEQLDVY